MIIVLFLNKVACKNKRFDFLKLIVLSFDIFLDMRDCLLYFHFVLKRKQTFCNQITRKFNVFLFGFSLMFDLMSGTDYLTYIKI